MADTTVSDAAKAMLVEPILVTAATVNPGGSVHVTPVWVDVDGDDILLNTLTERKEFRNATANGQIAVNAIDPANPFRVVAVTGRVVDTVTDGAVEQVNTRAPTHRHPTGRETP